MQVESVGDPVGGDGVRGAGRAVGIDELAIRIERALEQDVVDTANANENAGARASQPVWRFAGILQRLPGDLQQHALLGIGSACVAIIHSEHCRIEFVHAVDKAAPVVTDLLDGLDVARSEPQILVPLRRRGAQAVAARSDQIPEGIERLSAGQATGGTCDCRFERYRCVLSATACRQGLRRLMGSLCVGLGVGGGGTSDLILHSASSRTDTHGRHGSPFRPAS